MNQPGQQRPTARQIFLQACEIAGAVDRNAYLDQACGGDANLRRLIEAMLRVNTEAASNPLDRVGNMLKPVGAMQDSNTRELGQIPGDSQMIGPYKLLEEIGQGGFGTVYLADQTAPVKRKVALKVLKPGMDTKEVLARFEAERQALALMDHPHIAKVLDGGTTGDGRPFFVMELVHGVQITEYCDDARLSNEERLRLFIEVCMAVQHAHQKGIIHRDLKPSNVLVTIHDDTAVPKVIDFGIAKALNQQLTDRTLFTGYHQLLGTPLYMSPEQAQMSGNDVDTRSDVYSLGVLLYELLTGTTPFTKESLSKVSFDELRKIIREQEPQRPSARLTTLDAQARSITADCRRLDQRSIGEALRGELDWIVMKALEKDRNRRYESASALAADVQRFLNNEAVQACPPTARYQLQKLAVRHRPLIVTSTVAAVALCVGLVLAIWQAVEADRERNRANQTAEMLRQEVRLSNAERQRAEAAEIEQRRQTDRAEDVLYASSIRLANRNMQAGDDEQARQLLEEWIPGPDVPDRRGLEWHLLYNQLQVAGEELLRLPGDVSCVRISPDGSYLVAATDGGTIQRYSFADESPLASWETHLVDVRRMEFNNTGTLLAVISYEAEVAVIDTAVGDIRQHFPKVATTTGFPDVAFVAGKLVCFGRHQWATVWDPRTDSEQTWDPRLARAVLDVGTFAGREGLALIATYDEEPIERCLLVSSLAEPGLTHEFGLNFDGSAIALSPDGRTLAIGGHQGEVKLWRIDQQGLKSLVEYRVSEKINELAFSPDGTSLAAAERTGVVHVWHQGTDQSSAPEVSSNQHQHWQAHLRPARSVVFTPDGSCLITAGFDGRIMRWPVKRSTTQWIQKSDDNHQLLLLPRLQALVVAGDCELTVHDLRTAEILAESSLCSRQEAIRRLAADDTGQLIAVATYSNKFLCGDIGARLQLAELPVRVSEKEMDIHLLEFLPSTRNLLAAVESAGLRVRVWDAARSQLVIDHQFPDIVPYQCTLLGTSGRLVVAAPGELLVIHPQTAEIEQRLPFAGEDVSALAATQDGSLLAVGRKERTLTIVDLRTGEIQRVLMGHLGAIAKLEFTTDGRTLLACDSRQQMRLWHIPTGAELLTWGEREPIWNVDISGDGHWLAVAHGDSDRIEILRTAPQFLESTHR